MTRYKAHIQFESLNLIVHGNNGNTFKIFNKPIENVDHA